MRTSELLALVAQIAVPLFLLGRVAFIRSRSATSLGIDVALGAVYLVALALTIPALAAPWYLPHLFGGLLALAAVIGARRRTDPPAGRRRWPALISLSARGGLTLLFAAIAAYAFFGRRPPEARPVRLETPLRGGTYLVANGGGNTLVNPHLGTLTGDRYRDYRGQSYALDIVAVGRWGSRTASLSPDDPTGFAIFGDSLLAPCGGTVVRVSDGQPDRLPPGEPPATLEGNHVIIDCDGVWVVLAHLQRGSVRVRRGEPLEMGQPVGLVGNSGSSDEPHLHLHAQAPGTEAAPLSGDPLPLIINGRRLVRNDRIRTPGSANHQIGDEPGELER